MVSPKEKLKREGLKDYIIVYRGGYLAPKVNSVSRSSEVADSFSTDTGGSAGARPVRAFLVKRSKILADGSVFHLSREFAEELEYLIYSKDLKPISGRQAMQYIESGFASGDVPI